MDYTTWNHLTREQQNIQRDLSGLNPQLLHLKGWRVEVIDDHGNKRRFIVGQSTGWTPCNLEIKTRRSMGGDPADRHYASVKPIERVR